jgi:hypothetical protein
LPENVNWKYIEKKKVSLFPSTYIWFGAAVSCGRRYAQLVLSINAAQDREREFSFLRTNYSSKYSLQILLYFA